MMLCYNCKKTKESSCFIKAKACDECYDKTKAYREANKERYQANRRAKAAIKNAAKQKEREDARHRLDEEKAKAWQQQLQEQLAKRVCPYQKLRDECITTKECSKCHKDKAIEDYRIVVKRGVEQLGVSCTMCFTKDKERYEANKSTILAKNKEYKVKNADRVNERRRHYLKETHEYVRQREKAYWDRNREHLNAKIAEYQRTSKHVRMKARISSRIRENIKKLKSTKDYLGCGGDIEVLLRWLEHQFDDKMSWDNYGKYWQLDHVLPVKKFNMDDEKEVHMCFSWMNVQPLERLTNTSKHHKIIPEMVDKYVGKLKSYSISASFQDEVNTYLTEYIPLYNKFMALQKTKIKLYAT